MKAKMGIALLGIVTFVAMMFGGASAQAAVGPYWTNYHKHVIAWNAWGPFDYYCTYADYKSATGITIVKHKAIKCSWDLL